MTAPGDPREPIPDVPELLALLRQQIEAKGGPYKRVPFDVIRARAAAMTNEQRAQARADIERAERDLEGQPAPFADPDNPTDAEIDAMLAEVDVTYAKLSPEQRHELRLGTEMAALDFHPGLVRRVFRRGRRLGPCLYAPGDPEPDPPIPLSSNQLHWRRGDDGLWRASNLRGARYAYPWRFLLNGFPQLVEVLPGDPSPPVYRVGRPWPGV